jgi:nitrogen fixation protein NifQ
MSRSAVRIDSNFGDNGEQQPVGTIDNRAMLLAIVTSQRAGKTCLPHQLGLTTDNYDALCEWFKGDPSLTLFQQAEPQENLRQELLSLRWDEWKDLRDLLILHCNSGSPMELWIAEIVAAGCLGGGHLWRDLGLPSRATLRELLEGNFTALAVRNNQDMKWKKYFYKQLCGQEGGYVCRAPSCEQCAAYDECFGSEE